MRPPVAAYGETTASRALTESITAPRRLRNAVTIRSQLLFTPMPRGTTDASLGHDIISSISSATRVSARQGAFNLS